MNINRGDTSKACASCKFQRRKCSKDCLLAPYFPADKPQVFGNAHRLFGVSNVSKILKQVKEEYRDEAMKSIIFESDMRAQFPVGGCLDVIMMYLGMINASEQELKNVKFLLDHCKVNCPLQQQNLEPYLSIDHSSALFSSTQVPNPYYDIPHNVIISPIDTKQDSETNSMDAARVTQLSGVSNNGGGNAMEEKSSLMVTQGLFHCEELLDLNSSSTKFDLREKEKISVVDKVVNEVHICSFNFNYYYFLVKFYLFLSMFLCKYIL